MVRENAPHKCDSGVCVGCWWAIVVQPLHSSSLACCSLLPPSVPLTRTDTLCPLVQITDKSLYRSSCLWWWCGCWLLLLVLLLLPLTDECKPMQTHTHTHTRTCGDEKEMRRRTQPNRPARHHQPALPQTQPDTYLLLHTRTFSADLRPLAEAGPYMSATEKQGASRRRPLA